MSQSSLSELLAQKAALEQQIHEAQREQRAQAIAQVRALMSEYGLTLADLGSRATTGARKSGGGTVAPKFRYPQTGETWSGRGLQPKWLKAALASGARIDDFRI
jgi:DNA-binding protein H-NS